MPRPYPITAIDIGSGFIKILSVLKKPGDLNFEIIAQYELPSFGVRKGVVIDVLKTSEIISSLVQKVQEQSGIKIENVWANIGGGHIMSTGSKGLVSVSRADQKVSEEDIERVLQAAQTFHLPSNKEILEVFPREFIVDDESGIKEPAGMQGVRLEVDALIVFGFSPYIKNSSQAISHAQLQFNHFIPSPIASARAVLTPREKELGVAVLDIGAGTTDMVVFEEDSVIDVAVFPIGSGHITNDIAICFKTDIDTAERIKLEFGCCRTFPGVSKSGSKDEKKTSVEGEEKINFSRKELSEIIEARTAEFFELANKELKRIGRQTLLPAGIVLTGGGAKLLGIKDFAKKILKLPCRIGAPLGFSSLQIEPNFSTLCGLILEGADYLEENKNFSLFQRGIAGKIKRFFRAFIP